MTRPRPHKPILALLQDARTLLVERGWEPVPTSEPIPFGPESGPLTLTRALWRAGCHEDRVCVQDIGLACRVLCVVAGLGEEASFPELGAWSRTKTPEAVLALIERACEKWQAAGREFMSRLEVALAEDEALQAPSEPVGRV
jgi:hypothetical protein